MNLIYQSLAELEKNNESAALCTVISSEGSTPRHVGSKMLVYPDGKFTGTVGGGELESRVIKAALESSLAFLAKSFSRFSQIRFNAVGPSLLKTSASAGIPGYIDSYLYAEQVIPRKAAVETQEAANVAAFLLSPRSSGINAQSIVVDAGMSINYFDAEVVRRAMRPENE